MFWHDHDSWCSYMKLNWKEILMVFDVKLSKELHLFWFILTKILWVIWKARNEDKYSGVQRNLTKLNKRLTFFLMLLCRLWKS